MIEHKLAAMNDKGEFFGLHEHQHTSQPFVTDKVIEAYLIDLHKVPIELPTYYIGECWKLELRGFHMVVVDVTTEENGYSINRSLKLRPEIHGETYVNLESDLGDLIWSHIENPNATQLFIALVSLGLLVITKVIPNNTEGKIRFVKAHRWNNGAWEKINGN